MLRQRVITALLLLPLVLWLVLFADTTVFAVVSMLVFALTAHEWAGLNGLSNWPSLLFSLLLLGLMSTAWLAGTDVDYRLLMGVVSVGWLGLTLWLILQRNSLQERSGIFAGSLLLGFVLLFVAWFAVIEVRGMEPYGTYLLLALLLLIWIADTAAYFTGRAIGRHKLSPCVSPGKSWEGVLGALLAVAVYGYLLPAFQWFQFASPWLVALVFVLVAFVSVGGDLFESRIKRLRGVKDSGSILPGHGGLYDRLDSLIAAAPVYLLGLLLMEGSLW